MSSSHRLRLVKLAVNEFHQLAEFNGSEGWVLQYELSTSEAQILLINGPIAGTVISACVTTIHDVMRPAIEEAAIYGVAPGYLSEKKQGA